MDNEQLGNRFNQRRIPKYKAFYKGRPPLDNDEPDVYEKPCMLYNIESIYDGHSDIKGPREIYGSMGAFSHFLNNEDFIVLEDIGIPDKDGESICQDDIVMRVDGALGVVQYGKHLERSSPHAQVGYYLLFPDGGKYTNLDGSLKVIGSIHTHSKLLLDLDALANEFVKAFGQDALSNAILNRSNEYPWLYDYALKVVFDEKSEPLYIQSQGDTSLGLEPLNFELVGILDIPKRLAENDINQELIAKFMLDGHPNGAKTNGAYKPGMVDRISENVIAVFLATQNVNVDSQRKLFSHQDVVEYRSKFPILEYNANWCKYGRYEDFKNAYSQISNTKTIDDALKEVSTNNSKKLGLG